MFVNENHITHFYYCSISGQTPDEMLKEYNKRTNYTEPHATNLMAQAHDAIWAMALALNVTEAQLIETGKRSS